MIFLVPADLRILNPTVDDDPALDVCSVVGIDALRPQKQAQFFPKLRDAVPVYIDNEERELAYRPVSIGKISQHPRSSLQLLLVCQLNRGSERGGSLGPDQ
jgi:hypothetical protein